MWLENLRANLDRTLLAALVFLLPFERIPSFSLAGITMRPSMFVGGLIILRFLYLVLRRQIRLTLQLPEWFFLGFLTWSVILIPFSENRHRAVEVVLFTAFTMMIAYSVARLLRREYLPALLKALVAAVVTVSVFGLYQYFGNLAGLSQNLTGLRDRYSWQLFGFPRIQSTGLEPLYYAAYLLLPLSIISAASVFRRFSAWRVTAIFLGALNLYLTVSRGGTAASLLIIILLAIIAIRSRRPRSAFMLIGLFIVSYIAALLMVSYLNEPIAGSITHKRGLGSYSQQIHTTGLEGEGDERAKARHLAWGVFKAHRLTGVGPGNYGPAVQGNREPASGWVIVNNETLELLAETGIPGLLLVVLGGITLLWKAIRKAAGEPVWIYGLIVFLVAIAAQYQTFSTLYIIHIWTAIGLLLGLTLISEAVPAKP